jgi:hypothetical protein
VDLWSVIDIGPIGYSFGQFKFPERLLKSDGTKGHIDMVWQKLKSELDDPNSIDPRCKIRYGLADKNLGNTPRSCIMPFITLSSLSLVRIFWSRGIGLLIYRALFVTIRFRASPIADHALAFSHRGFSLCS